MRAELEHTIASYFHRKHCLLVGSGTTAIYVILKALDLPAEARVLYPDITCETALNAAIYAGIRPVFADIDAHTFNMDLGRAAALLNNDAVQVVVASHLFGTIFDVEALRRALGDREIFVLEDAAQAYGGWSGDTPVGKLGDAAIISFGPGKLLDCGAGGAVLTDSDELYERCKAACGTLESNAERRAACRDEYLKAIYTLTKECHGAPTFWRRRDQLKREYRDAYLSAQVQEAALRRISRCFSSIDSIAATRRERFGTLWRVLAECPDVVLPRQIGTPAPWRCTFTVNHDRDSIFDRLITRGGRASRFFKPLHLEYGLCDEDYPQSIRFFDGVLNVDLDVDDHTWCRSVICLKESLQAPVT